MRRSFKYGKVTIVVFLTILVWVWADLAKTDEETVSNATIRVSESTGEDLWVSFEGQPSSSIEVIKLTGAASRIDGFRRWLRTSKLTFEYDATEQFETPQSHSLSLLPFLKEQRIIRDLGLDVDSCEPKTIPVKVVKLVKKSLDVKCFDKNDNPWPATVIPQQVSMYVPDTNESFGFAKVLLSDSDIQQAKDGEITKRPFIALAPGVIRRSQPEVSISITGELDLEPFNITPVLGFVASQGLLNELLEGTYAVELLDEHDVRSQFKIRATREAYNAYRDTTFHVFLEINDDAKSEETSRQRLIYNFPDEYVRTDQIMLDPPNSARVVQFKLVPKPPAGEAPNPPSL